MSVPGIIQYTLEEIICDTHSNSLVNSSIFSCILFCHDCLLETPRHNNTLRRQVTQVRSPAEIHFSRRDSHVICPRNPGACQVDMHLGCIWGFVYYSQLTVLGWQIVVEKGT